MRRRNPGCEQVFRQATLQQRAGEEGADHGDVGGLRGVRVGARHAQRVHEQQREDEHAEPEDPLVHRRVLRSHAALSAAARGDEEARGSSASLAACRLHAPKIYKPNNTVIGIYQSKSILKIKSAKAEMC